jgi:DNA (cytosine-5)-methyltransferase 1
LGRIVDGLSEGVDSPWGAGWEDGTARVATTAADKVDRRKRLIALGNAVVPQIPELIGRAIMRAAGLAA